MSEELKYFFTFGWGHVNPETGEPLKDYWVEVIMHEDVSKLTSMEISLYRERARQIMFKRYERTWSMQYDERNFKPSYFPKGCYQKLYYPLPDDIIITNQFSVGDIVKLKPIPSGYIDNKWIAEVIRVEENHFEYTGYQYVYVIIEGREHQYHASNLEKVNK